MTAVRARRRGTLIAMPVFLGLLLLLSVRKIARSERILAADEANAGRLVTHAIEPGQQLRIPIETNTDVVRVVAQAFRRGALDQGRHAGRVTVRLDGTDGTRRETLDVSMPGVSRRTIAEEGDVAVGDPIAVNVDVRETGATELVLGLDSIADADGLLARAYRREAIGPSETFKRRVSLGEAKREHLARGAGEVGWIDLEPGDRTTLASARWRKVAPLPEPDRALVSRTLTLATRTPEVAEPVRERVGDYELRGDERIAGVVRGPNVIVARWKGNTAARLGMTTHADGGGALTAEGPGMARLEIPPGKTVSFEVSTSVSGHVALDASDAEGVTLASSLAYFRTSQVRPVVVAADDGSLVLRVSARKPVARSTTEPVAISLAMDVGKPSGARVLATLAGVVARSRVDRYELPSGEVAPSEPAVFYVLVPAGGRATLKPAEGELDLSLSELDPRAPPRPAAATESPTGIETRTRWPGFVARRPTNAQAFEPSWHGILRVAQRFDNANESEPKLPVLRVVRPPASPTLRLDDGVFEPVETSFTVDVGPGTRARLPIHLYARAQVKVVVEIDGGHPRRRAAGSAAGVTVARSVQVADRGRMTLILGDDLAPGRHKISFTRDPALEVWVHLPWARRGARQASSQWISGDFDP